MNKDDWDLTTDKLMSADEYLIVVSDGFYGDEICSLGTV
jgi:hypothetical protein